MVLRVALLACLVSVKGGPRLPPRPDFAEMIPQTSSTFVGRVSDNWNPARREAVALAKYLNRLWDVAATLDEPAAYALDLMTAFQQFNVALSVLNPDPTVGEATARVYAYQPVVVLMRRRIESVDTHPESVNDRVSFQLHAQLHRMNRQMARQYGPVFARTVLRVRFG